MDIEATLNAGDVCLDCQQKGIEKYLRYFKINLHGDTILKCESNQCMYPYNDDISSSDDEDKCFDNVSQTNNLKLINDLIAQFDYEEDVEDTLNHIPIIESHSEQVEHFDITFLDDFKAEDNENLCKTENIDDKTQYFPLLETKTIRYDGVSGETSAHYFQPLTSKLSDSPMADSIPPDDNMMGIKKEKIKIQSVETLKTENSLYHCLPSTSKKSKITGENSVSNLYTPLAVEETHKINKNKLKSQTKVIHSSNRSTAAAPQCLPAATEKSQTCDIPKAEISKANAVLKEFASKVESEPIPTYNKKCKKDQKIVCQKNKKTSKLTMPETSPSLNTDTNYSFDVITQMLLAKK